MPRSPAQDLLERETRVSYGAAPRRLGGEDLAEDSWQLAGEEFLLRATACHYFHYRRGAGVTIERGPGADPSVEALYLSGSVYSAAASINGFLPIHASAVCHDDKVYAFTGPSGAGKSTLVTALGNFGLPLFCDDTLVFDLSDPDDIVCLPGHKRLKLTEEALALTGAARQEQVGEGIEKFYCAPPTAYEGGPLPLARLIFLEEGTEPAIASITGAERMMRLQDDHYTAMHFAAARRFDPASHFDHLARLARQIEMARFVRPMDFGRFGDGVAFVRRYIADAANTDPGEDMTGLTKLTARFSETQIDDEVVIMLLDSGEFLSLAGTAGAIWRLIDGARDRQAIVAALALEYEAPEAEIAADVDEFLGSLREAGLLAGG